MIIRHKVPTYSWNSKNLNKLEFFYSDLNLLVSSKKMCTHLINKIVVCFTINIAELNWNIRFLKYRHYWERGSCNKTKHRWRDQSFHWTRWIQQCEAHFSVYRHPKFFRLTNQVIVLGRNTKCHVRNGVISDLSSIKRFISFLNINSLTISELYSFSLFY